MLDEKNCLYRNLNKEMILMEKVENKFDQEELKSILEKHVQYTDSAKGKMILENYEEYLPKFKKLIPGDYKKLIQLSSKFEEQGMSIEEAQIEAFYASLGINS